VRDTTIWAFGDFELDLAAWRLSKGGTQVALEPKAIEVLALLVERAGEVVGKDDLLAAVWKDTVVTENAMVRVIAHLRGALGDDARQPHFIETVHTRGYRFVAPVAVRTATAQQGPGGDRTVAGPQMRRAWRRPVIVAAALVALIVAAAIFLVRVRGWPRAAPPPGGAAGAIPSVAVLPLDNLGPPEQQYFADGMTEEITTQLGKIEALRVIARSAVTPYRDRRPRPSVIARELGVTRLVEGSALLAGERVRITARLIDASSDRQLWSESYEGDLTDVLALQGRVSRSIARAIRARVTPEEEGRLAAARTVNPAAYAEYLEGLSLNERQMAAGPDQGPLICRMIERFEAAVALDPEWGEAHGQLANAYQKLALTSDDLAEVRRSFEQARRCAQRALDLDPGVVNARLVLARIHIVVDGDWEGGEREYREALRLLPNSADWGYGRMLMLAGRFDEAYQQLERVRERWPTTPWLPYDIGALHLCEGRVDRAEEQLGELRRRFPGHPWTVLLEARVLTRRGRYADAADLLERHRRALLVNHATTFLLTEAYAAARAGQPERARRAVAEIEARGGRSDVSTIFALGDLAEVRREVEKRHAERDHSLHFARCWTEYDRLMQIPEVARILREAGPPPRPSSS
jgi:TolB-like protein/DNA-binding winged helix-turn-helix (wHTH) protein/Tfp pilus assembly protein PilF